MECSWRFISRMNSIHEYSMNTESHKGCLVWNNGRYKGCGVGNDGRNKGCGVWNDERYI